MVDPMNNANALRDFNMLANNPDQAQYNLYNQMNAFDIHLLNNNFMTNLNSGSMNAAGSQDHDVG
jgi:hypothetical protein